MPGKLRVKLLPLSVKGSQLSWCWHLSRMLLGHIPLFSQTRPTGKRPRGRPRICLRDSITHLAWEHLGVPQRELVVRMGPGSPCEKPAAVTRRWINGRKGRYGNVMRPNYPSIFTENMRGSSLTECRGKSQASLGWWGGDPPSTCVSPHPRCVPLCSESLYLLFCRYFGVSPPLSRATN